MQYMYMQIYIIIILFFSKAIIIFAVCTTITKLLQNQRTTCITSLQDCQT